MNATEYSTVSKNVKDLTGMTFSRLTVTEFAGVDKRKKAQWLCQCGCGNVLVVMGYNLHSGATQSCGCLNKERTREVHAIMVEGKPITEHPLYKTWHNMISRCTNPNYPGYSSYGARGIHVCHRWQLPNGEGLSNFANDMGAKPSAQHTLERGCNDDGYGPGNCIWAPRAVQDRNKRTNVWFLHENTRMVLTDLATRLGIDRKALSARYRALKATNKIPRTYSGDYVVTPELIAKVA